MPKNSDEAAPQMLFGDGLERIVKALLDATEMAHRLGIDAANVRDEFGGINLALIGIGPFISSNHRASTEHIEDNQRGIRRGRAVAAQKLACESLAAFTNVDSILSKEKGEKMPRLSISAEDETREKAQSSSRFERTLRASL